MCTIWSLHVLSDELANEQPDIVARNKSQDIHGRVKAARKWVWDVGTRRRMVHGGLRRITIQG